MACTISKEELARVKGLGFLLNKDTDCFNGRVITRNGKITIFFSVFLHLLTGFFPLPQLASSAPALPALLLS